MLQKNRFLAFVVALLTGHAATLAAPVTFYTTVGSFNTAVSSLSFMGSEDWSSAVGASIASVNDPVQPGIANLPVFPTGTNVASVITVQSNNLAGAAVLSPTGSLGMFYANTGTVGLSGNVQPSKQLSSAGPGDTSFDIIFASVGALAPRAVDMSPMYYQGTAMGSATGTLTIRVFDSGNVLRDTTTVANVADSLENAYLGIVLDLPFILGRVNVSATSTNYSGADNIRVYGAAVPEASSLLFGVVAAVGAAGWRFSARARNR